MCFYDDQNFYYAHVSHDEELGTCLGLFEILSDEHTTFDLGFTGAFGALAAHDMTGQEAVADFDYFEYVEL